MALYGADAVTIDRNAREFKLPDQFEWNDRPGSASKTATLFGDPGSTISTVLKGVRSIPKTVLILAGDV